jgi:hypothetical protein
MEEFLRNGLQTPNSEIEFKVHKIKKDVPATFLDFTHVHQYLCNTQLVKLETEKLLRVSVSVGAAAGAGSREERIRYELKDSVSDNFIEKYCKDNSLENATCVKKTQIGHRYNMNEWSTEGTISSEEITKFDNYAGLNRYSRYIQRTSFRSTYFQIDISIVITNKNQQIGKIFTGTQGYEFEIEMIKKDGVMTEVLKDLRRCMMYLHMGLQDTQYPVNLPKYEEYLRICDSIKGTLFSTADPVLKLGLKPRTLTQEACIDLCTSKMAQPYRIADKADGEHHILCIVTEGRNANAFLIDSFNNIKNIDIAFIPEQIDPINPGANPAKIVRVLDGELIYRNDGTPIYYSYDFYFLGAISQKGKFSNNKIYDKFLTQRIDEGTKCIQPFKCKGIELKFKEYSELCSGAAIFAKCGEWLRGEEKEYKTDGLILMPERKLLLTETKAVALQDCYKWKPPNLNTVDFLVRKVGEATEGQQKIQLFTNVGTDTGFNETSLFTYLLSIDPGSCETLLSTLLPYRPINGHILFQPVEESDSSTNETYVTLDTPGNMMCEDGKEAFTDNQIVEFRWQFPRSEAEKGQWIPIRVRLDKLQANYIDVANETFISILQNINGDRLEHICRSLEVTGRSIAKAYYSLDSSQAPTNKYNNAIKLKIINDTVRRLQKPNITVIDFSVGQYGDFQKLYGNAIGFVVGIDIDPGNIKRAAKRYLTGMLQDCKRGNALKSPNFITLFVCGDSSQNIRSGRCLLKPSPDNAVSKDLYEMSQKVISQLYGAPTEPDRPMLSKCSLIRDGFEISMCQFAIHYFFESVEKLNGFIKNVVENTKVGGYFIGTCMDGKYIHSTYLHNKNMYESYNIYEDPDVEDRSPIVKITKYYENEDIFRDDTTDANNIGYEIRYTLKNSNIVNSKEWLVNLKYLEHKLKKKNFNMIQVNTFRSVHDLKDAAGVPITLDGNRRRTAEYLTYFIFQKVRGLAKEGEEEKEKEIPIEEEETRDIIVSDISIPYVKRDLDGMAGGGGGGGKKKRHH